MTAGKGKKFKGDCRICGKKGHKANDCWDNNKNKDKRPSWYKSPDQRKKAAETANAATNNSTNTSTPTSSSSATANAATRPTYHCNYCNRDGHTEDRCFKKKAVESPKTPETANVALVCTHVCSLTTEDTGKVNSNTFLADSGASCHMVHSKHFLTDFVPDDGTVTIGDK